MRTISLCKAFRKLISTNRYPGSWSQILESVQVSSNLNIHSEHWQNATYQGSTYHLTAPLSETGPQPSWDLDMPPAIGIIIRAVSLLLTMSICLPCCLPKMTCLNHNWYCAHVCPHSFSSTFGIWIPSGCQQLQSASTRGVPLEKAWKEPMGDNNSTWPKLVEHYLHHSSFKSCLQTQNAPSGKSADLCSPNNAVLFFLSLLKSDTDLYAT